jgi:hypothetical protein
MKLTSIGTAVILTFTAMAADTVTLKTGRVIAGEYLGGSARQVRLDTGDKIQSIDVADITTIQFGAPSQGNESAARTSPAGAISLPAGAKLVVRMIDSVDSERNSVGQTFAASLDEPVLIDGAAVVPRGADVVVKLVDEKESGKLTGRASLMLDLVSVKVQGRVININTRSVTEESSSRGARTAKVAGGTAALGAIIGAVAGGGKGAAIGGGAGAAAGAGAQVLTKGQRVRIPSETRLTFIIENPVRIN